jgi:methyl-accepting chemotaxis protein
MKITTVQKIVNENKNKVAGMASDGRNKVEQGIEIAQKCGNALEEIVGQASSINHLIAEITTAVKEQSKGIVEVSQAMSLLDQKSNQNSVTSQETLFSAQELKDQAHKLENVIDSLSSMMTTKRKAS